MREYGLNNFNIELIENLPRSCKGELRAQEGRCIREIGTLNIKIAGRDGNNIMKITENFLPNKINTL